MELANMHYWGMHWIWWIFWIFLLELLLFTPWGSSKKLSKSSLLHTLRRTYAEGKISTHEFEEQKQVLEREFQKQDRDQTIEADKNKTL